ncbi:MAG: 2-oxoglutarate dehydrogenase complex dihydrolipoyllysine-residue succinyltransferase [Phycisphaerales bacterium]|nr:2-oxoglutarate dehydrogenase complex dihydrolipoyllysine-residue succinyltransferase [Phycisphaerales bacterium]
MVDVIVPSPGESISEVRLGTWKRGDGDWVEKDELLNEIESDKATLELLAPASGLLKIKADSGSDQKVKAVVAAIDEKAAKPAGAAKAAAAGAPAATVAADAAGKGDAPAARSAATATRATPVARKLAADKGVDLASVPGSGPAGRVMRADVEAASGGEPVRASAPAPAAPARSAPPPPMPVGGRGMRREKMTKLRMRIAERLVESQQTTATLTTFNEVDMSEIARLRAEHKEHFEKRHGIGLGMMSFFIAGTVSALRRFPRLNAFIVGDEIEYHDYMDIGVAVGTDRGLVVPVMRNAESMSFADMERQVRDFAIRGRDGKLSIDEMTGGTFTVSNGGVYGSLMSTPILNPPQSGILGMHGIKRRPVEDPHHPGQIVIRPMMYIAMSYDHRIVDGTEAVQFLAHIKECCEKPERMLLGL